MRQAEAGYAESLPEHERDGVFHVSVDDAVGGPDQTLELLVENALRRN